MSLIGWIDDRTSLVTRTRALMNDPLPGGARWRNVSGAVVVFLFGVQVFTGLLLACVYSPAATTAWSSVWYAQTQVPAGWIVRGLHHFASDAMLVALGVYALQLVIGRAYRAPREFIWWGVLCLLGMTLALSLSGHLLPWDQEGYWGTKVRLNILARTPLIGDALRRLLAGGSEFGHLTLARFYTLHALVLPGMVAMLLCATMRLNRRYRAKVVADQGETPAQPYCPGQCVRDTAACAIVLAMLLGAVWYVRDGLGLTLLGAPADPTTSDFPARPEWHTLFLYQGLTYFEGPTMEMVGAIAVPAGLVGLWFAFPLLSRMMWSWMAHGLVLLFTAATIGGAGWLTYEAMLADVDPAIETIAAIQARRNAGETLSDAEETALRTRQFNKQRQAARRMADRAVTLANEQGVPPEGPLALLAGDPVTRGPALFAANCASCHRFNGHDGLGNELSEPATSSDLGGFASRKWIRGLLDNPMRETYFGLMVKPDGDPAHTRMSRWVSEALMENEAPADRAALLANFEAVAAYLEDESNHPGRIADELSEDVEAPRTGASEPDTLLMQGRRYFVSTCNECHRYRGERTGTLNGPEMHGYGSVEWIALMIANPAHDLRYRSRGRERAQMPAFQDRLSQQDRYLLAQWLHTPG